MVPVISIHNLSKNFGNTKVLDEINLEIMEGEISVIFGPNGCGKSTLLNILTGIENATTGNVIMESGIKQHMSYIFQNYRETLMPWKSNYENVAFPLRLKAVNEEKIAEKIAELEKIFDLKCEHKKYPYQLSGGQQQILAFMRALITEPKLLLIDEPFSSLDYENNLLLRSHLQKYYLTFKPTIVLVTHNIEEAVHLADKIVILSKGPSKIKNIIKNNIPRPRNLDNIETTEFNHVRDAVFATFREAANI